MTKLSTVIGILDSFMQPLKPYTLTELATAILEALEGQNKAYRRSFRPETLLALRMLRDRELTTKEFGYIVKSQSARKVLSELADGELVTQFGKKKGNRVYRITQKGLDFLDGKVSTPCYWYPYGKGESGELKFVSEIRVEHPLDNPIEHARVASF
jgi:hypothetical protein